jgi:hypothetical protein
MLRCEVQARVALVVVVGVAQVLGVVVDDAPDESEVIEYDGSAQSALYINPEVVRMYCINNDAREDFTWRPQRSMVSRPARRRRGQGRVRV